MKKLIFGLTLVITSMSAFASNQVNENVKLIKKSLVKIEKAEKSLLSAKNTLNAVLGELEANSPQAYSSTSSYLTESSESCRDGGELSDDREGGTTAAKKLAKTKDAARLSSKEQCIAESQNCTNGDSFSYKLIFRNSKSWTYRCEVTSTTFEVH
jgi:peptidoglycan hydrolase CwlO-like protein